MKKAYIKPNLISEKFIPQTYCASCNFTTYKLKCTVSGNENSDNDKTSCNHRDDLCNNIEHQILTFDTNGYLKIYEIKNNYFSGSDCIIIQSPENDAPISIHRDNIKHGQTIYWKTTGTTDLGIFGKNDWECLHQGTINLNEDNKGNLT